MTLYRVEARIIKRSRGRRVDGAAAYRSGSAPAAAAYRHGARFTDWRNGEKRVYNYSNKLGIVHSEILLPPNGPVWAADRQTLWQAVESRERRKDSQLARELLLTLPIEVPLALILPKLRAWLETEAVAHGMIADLAIHAYGTALDPSKPRHARRIAELCEDGVPILKQTPGDRLNGLPPDGPHAWELRDGRILVYQPHAHIMLTMRSIDERGFGPKVLAWNKRPQLERWRRTWESLVNELLASIGSSERVSAVSKEKRYAEVEKILSTQSGANRPISPKPLRQRDLGGGRYAVMDGRPATREYSEDELMPSEWNEEIHELRRQQAAAKDGVEHLIRGLARIQDLQQRGVAFGRSESGGLTWHDSEGVVSNDDRYLWSGQDDALLKLLETGPTPAAPAPLDEELRKAMVEIDRLQAQGVRFRRTHTGALGFSPAEAVSPDVYKGFAGKHSAILAELDRQRLQSLWQKAEEARLDQGHRLHETERQRNALSQQLDHERESRRELEQETKALIGSAKAGRPLPDVSARNPILVHLRQTLGGLNDSLQKERRRAEKAAAVASYLGKQLRRIFAWVAAKQPEVKAQVKRREAEIFAKATGALALRDAGAFEAATPIAQSGVTKGMPETASRGHSEELSSQPRKAAQPTPPNSGNIGSTEKSRTKGTAITTDPGRAKDSGKLPKPGSDTPATPSPKPPGRRPRDMDGPEL